MKSHLLRKDMIKELCLSVSAKWELYLPIEDLAGEIQFTRLNKRDKILIDRIRLDYKYLTIPPKVIVFPQLESLFEFRGTKIIETLKPRHKKILFGIHPCDAKGILFMNNFFKRDFKDIYYLNRALDTLLIVVGCNNPLDTCFCSSVKTGPFLTYSGDKEAADFDLQLTDLGKQYLVEIGSKRGEEFISIYAKFFTKASRGDVILARAIKHNAEKSININIDIKEVIKRFCEDDIPQHIYDRIAQRCIYCGGCLYVCPTCSCFNIFDEKIDKYGKRYRNWDACVFEGYTRQASGYNPRKEKGIRAARRYEHKLKYDYLTMGKSGCVGCGRCLVSCPVNIGMSQVIQEVLSA